MKICDALPILVKEEAARLVNDEEIKHQPLDAAEQNGIMFIDELDKVARRSEFAGADVSREGVQRDLQGRRPIRVELRALEVEDFKRILTEPEASLTEQYRALMETEGVTLEFTEDGVRRSACWT